MKKVLIVIAVLLAVLAGIFFWKGGHHALVLADVLEEWLDEENADQSLTVQFQKPHFSVNDETGLFQPEISHWTIFADSFWTEYDNERIFGLTAQGITAYLSDGCLYLDTGKAYALPKLSELNLPLKRLAMGFLLYGRVTKSGDTYHISMKTDEMELSASVTAASQVQRVTVMAILPDDASIYVTAGAKEPASHPIPQPVADAMARKDAPIPLAEPLDILLPSMESLFPLSGSLELGVSCGILELTEDVELTVSGSQATLTRNGRTMELELPVDVSELPPAAGALLLLRSGDVSQDGDAAQLAMTIPAETASAMLEALIPQAEDLGISLADSTLTIRIRSGRIESAAMRGEGAVPFLFTSIPVDFYADLTVSGASVP